MILSTILFVSVDAAVKQAGKTVHSFEVRFLRNVCGFLFLLPNLSGSKSPPGRLNASKCTSARCPWRWRYACSLGADGRAAGRSGEDGVDGCVLHASAG